MKVQMLSLIASMFLLAGCAADDTYAETPQEAKGETPIRYVICGSTGGMCFVSARFSDFDACERHKNWSGMLCDTKSEPGKMICQGTSDNVATGYCTN